MSRLDPETRDAYCEAFNIPQYTEPLDTFEFSVGEKWRPAKIGQQTLDLDDGEITVHVKSPSPGAPELFIPESSYGHRDTIWTVVEWARSYGIPGVCKEFVHDPWTTHYLRLGALYVMAGYELVERETNYQRYGEYPTSKIGYYPLAEGLAAAEHRTDADGSHDPGHSKAVLEKIEHE